MSRAGRKRDALRKRELNGKAQRSSRPETAKEVRAVALEARRRVFDVPRHLLEAMPETSFLGYLAALGTKAGGISRRQWEAARDYIEVCEEVKRLHPVRGFPMPGDLNRAGGHDSGDGTEPKYVARFNAAMSSFNACEQALKGAHSTDIRVMSVTKRVVLDGLELHEEVSTLRVGLNALARVLKVPAERGRDDDVLQGAAA